MSSAQDAHQLDIEHIQIEHNHLSDDSANPLNHETNAGNSTGADHNVSDCHHCGHCHGSHTNWVTPDNESLLPVSQQLAVFTYLNAPKLGHYNGLYRPPTA